MRAFLPFKQIVNLTRTVKQKKEFQLKINLTINLKEGRGKK